jgi:mono/diheme cytochrome c family protein
MQRALVWLIITVIFGNQSINAQDTIEARQGRAFAQRICATCHGIVLGAPSSIAGAPNFYAIAATPGMSPLALRVALETPHHSMPNLVLTADELHDVTAYIMSLRAK